MDVRQRGTPSSQAGSPPTPSSRVIPVRDGAGGAAAQPAARVSAAPREGSLPTGDDDDSTAVDPQTGLQRGKRIIKTVTAAVLLFAVGSIMLWLGLTTLPTDKDRAIGMLVIGGLAFLPGSYATFILLGAWCRWDGYRYGDLPSYDD